MTPQDFLNIVMNCIVHAEIPDTIGIGGAYELQLRNFIAIHLRKLYGTFGIEVNYPGSKEKVDLAFRLDGQMYLIELKVESPTNSGHFSSYATLASAYVADTTKLAKFNQNPDFAGGTKWFVAVAYSHIGKTALANMSADVVLDNEAGLRAGLHAV